MILVESSFDDKVKYYGNEKPSIDTPIQILLYQNFPKINFMLHSHVYVDEPSSVFTSNPIPCGAIEEVKEILMCVKLDFEKEVYYINLKGHGSLIMASSPKYFENLKYKPRKPREKQCTI